MSIRERLSDRRGRRIRRSASFALIAYATVVAVVLLWPTPVDRPVSGLVRQLVEHAHRLALDWVSYSTFEIGANAILFIPFGVLVALAMPASRWWVAVLIGPAVSCTAEFLQAVLLPQRVPSAIDIAANSAGAILGVAAVAVGRLIHSTRTTRA